MTKAKNWRCILHSRCTHCFQFKFYFIINATPPYLKYFRPPPLQHWVPLSPSLLPYKRRKKPMKIYRKGATRFQNRTSKSRRDEREKEGDWTSRKQQGFVLKVVKVQIHILGASNLLFHHFLVGFLYTQACNPKSCCHCC